MKGYVYSIKFPNNKRYIGITVRKPKNRLKEHLNLSKTDKKRKLYKAIRKYKEENMFFEIINEVEDIDRHALFLKLCELETHYIKYYDSFKNGYNCTLGGEGTVGMSGDLNPFYGKKHSKETLKKLSELGFKRKHTDETRKKISEAGKGRKHNPESIAKMREREECKEVICLETGEIFPSITVCSEKTSICRSDIRGVCNGVRITAKGKRFRFIIDGVIQEVQEPENKRIRKIMCIQNGKHYASIKECCEDLNVRHQHVSAVLRGKQKQTKGYSFKYI